MYAQAIAIPRGSFLRWAAPLVAILPSILAGCSSSETAYGVLVDEPPLLFHVLGSSASHVLALGEHGNVTRFDGQRWTPIDPGIGADLHGCWMSGDSCVVLSGERGRVGIHDGHTWSVEQTGAEEVLYGVWGSSPQEVFVGAAGGTVLRRTDAGWSRIETGQPGDILCLAGTAFDDLHAIAADRGSSPWRWRILHHDGSGWRETLARQGVWFSPFAGPSRGSFYLLEMAFDVMRLHQWDGAGWALRDSVAAPKDEIVWGGSGPAIGPDGSLFLTITFERFKTSCDDNGCTMSLHWRTVIYRFDGSALAVDGEAPAEFTDLWISPEGEWFGLSYGELWHGRSGVWERENPGFSYGESALWGSGGGSAPGYLCPSGVRGGGVASQDTPAGLSLTWKQAHEVRYWIH